MSEQFEKMTVLELRRAAKEMGVKLGAGISKQGIIDKLTEAAAGSDGPSQAAPVSAVIPEAPAHPVRSAAIITDEEPEEDEDDIPVLTPNPALQALARPAPRPTAPAAPPSPAPAGASSLSTISAKAPAFTMEGSRAWHNPRAYQTQGNYQRPPSWGNRPAPAPGGEQRAYPRAGVPQRPDAPRPQAPRPAAYPQRFGPEQTNEERPVDYRPAPAYNPGEYQAPAPRNDYAPRGDYAAPRENAPYARPAQPAYYAKEGASVNPAIPEMLATGECGEGAGILEVHPDGYGFLRADRYLSGKNDVYVSNAQIRRFGLRSGDHVVGQTRPQRESERYSALLYITEINGHSPEENPARLTFEELTPLYPKRKINLAGKGENDPLLRLIDLTAPLGFGQRAMIYSSPKADKTTLLKKLAAAIARNHAKAHVMVLLVDEKPEEVTEMQEAVKGEVVYSTFDEAPETQVHVAELALERALRLVEMKKDVVILTDSLTRLARAYNTMAPQSARTLPNGLAAGAMTKPKRFFGAARSTKEAGTLTILATALASTGNPIEEAILEEFKGTANLEWVLTRTDADKRLCPNLSLTESLNRREELLLTPEEAAAAAHVRALLSQGTSMEQVLDLVEKTESNTQLVAQLNQSAQDASN